MGDAADADFPDGATAPTRRTSPTTGLPGLGILLYELHRRRAQRTAS